MGRAGYVKCALRQHAEFFSKNTHSEYRRELFKSESIDDGSRRLAYAYL